MLKVLLFFSSAILKYWQDLFSLEVLKNALVTSPIISVWSTKSQEGKVSKKYNTVGKEYNSYTFQYHFAQVALKSSD